MPALSGVSLGGGRVAAADLVATITGGDAQQDGLATVACEVVVTDPTGSETYAWTLTDPRGVSRTALFDDATIADPVFTPDLTGGGGQWVARVTVTRGASSLVLVKVITIGVEVAGGPNWVEVYEYVSNGSDSASPSGGTLVFGGLSWTVVNADAASGPKVDGGDLSITPNAASQITGTSIAGVAALRISLSALIGLSTVGTRLVMICAELEDYTPTASDEGFIIGLEVAGAGLGSGTGGRGVGAGQGVSSSTLRASRIIGQIGASSILRTSNASLTTTVCRSFAAIFCQSGVMAYSSSTAGALDTAAEVIAASMRQAGGGDAPNSYVAFNQVIIAVQKPAAGAAGVEFRLKELRVFVC